jgi:hypothetical protein
MLFRTGRNHGLEPRSLGPRLTFALSRFRLDLLVTGGVFYLASCQLCQRHIHWPIHIGLDKGTQSEIELPCSASCGHHDLIRIGEKGRQLVERDLILHRNLRVHLNGFLPLRNLFYNGLRFCRFSLCHG